MTALLGSLWLPLDISAHGYQVDRLIEVLHYFMALLFVGWGIFFTYCLVKFRARPGHAAQYEQIKAKPSKYAEIGIIVFEAFLLIGLSMPVWADYKNQPPDEGEAFVVRVVAQQFAWNIQYPGKDGVFGRTRPDLIDEAMNPIGLDRDSPGGGDDIVEINVMHVPARRPLLMRLTSKDVIHSFSIPLLRIKQDVIPGMEIPIWVTAEQTTDWVRDQETTTLYLQPPGEPNSRFNRKFKNHVVMRDAAGADGAVVLAANGLLTDASVQSLLDAGVTEVQMAPRSPVEIQCAQLCGLGHYRMRGDVIIMEPDAFAAWYDTAGQEEFFDEDMEFDD